MALQGVDQIKIGLGANIDYIITYPILVVFLLILVNKIVKRWAFLDLSAGPFAWGPAVGGEGVRTELSLPNVGKTIGAIEGISQLEFFVTSLLCWHVHVLVSWYIEFLCILLKPQNYIFALSKLQITIYPSEI